MTATRATAPSAETTMEQIPALRTRGRRRGSRADEGRGCPGGGPPRGAPLRQIPNCLLSTHSMLSRDQKSSASLFTT